MALSLVVLSLVALSLISVGLTVTFPKRSRQQSREESRLDCDALYLSLSVKTLEEQRQTAEGEVLPTKVTGEAFVLLGWSCGADALVREKRAARAALGDTVVAAQEKQQQEQRQWQRARAPTLHELIHFVQGVASR